MKTEALDHITAKAREDAIIWSNDKRLAHQFATRRQAIAEAKILGFRIKSATRIEIMGFQLWALANDSYQFLTRNGYIDLKGKVPKAG